ncbi:MAG: hypothetical protein IJP17_03935, partial [Clostridia bacterium]|nr:hypothetical protein [Clostridia bacterium]
MKKFITVLLILLVVSTVFTPVYSAQELEDSASYAGEGTGEVYVTPSDEGEDYTFEGEFTEDLQELATLVTGVNYRCRVLKVLSDDVELIDGGGYTLESRVQTLLVEVREGPYKGMTAEVTYDLTDTWGGGNGPKAAKKGDRLIAQFNVEDDGSITGLVTQYGRENSLTWLAIIFVALLAFFGGKRGIRSIIALIVT